jgi:hypothetical protein
MAMTKQIVMVDIEVRECRVILACRSYTENVDSKLVEGYQMARSPAICWSRCAGVGPIGTSGPVLVVERFRNQLKIKAFRLARRLYQ